jgi:alkanesulfonate monooxygenase SsuD/methylene tetrahydromethanopterin reductase-like flavin-dependent oxidoreductase (luciferase family)
MSRIHLGVALEGAGWHHAAWREPTARPDLLFTARYWAALARTAERGLLTIEDGLGLQTGDHLASGDRRTDQVRGRLDAELVAAYLAPLSRHIGLVPTVTTTHTEPFHVASAIATLDHDSRGRAGRRVQISARADEAAHFGRRTLPVIRREDLGTPVTAAVVQDLFDEAADAVEVVRRLWDSWEDSAEIREATNRFLDRDKVHPIDVSGRFFSVQGPSIVPRPPQGRPLVVSLGHGRVPYELAARAADVLLVTPHGEDLPAILGEVRAAQVTVGRTLPPLTVLADLVVVVDTDADADHARLRRLEEVSPLRSDAAAVAGTPSTVADLLESWSEQGLDGFRTAYEPGIVNHDTVWSDPASGSHIDPASGSHIDFASFEHWARTAERGTFDLLFLAEGLRLRTRGGQVFDQDVVGRPDTFTVLAALAAVTAHIGLAGTINATFNEPCELARRFATLDILSGGRAAWNVVTSSDADTGREPPPWRLPPALPALRAGGGDPGRRPRAVGLLGVGRRRRGQGGGPLPAGRARGGLRLPGRAVRHRRPVLHPAQPAGPPGRPAGRRVPGGPGLRGLPGRVHPRLPRQPLRAGRGGGPGGPRAAGPGRAPQRVHRLDPAREPRPPAAPHARRAPRARRSAS